jgi:hypothetical protein
MKLVSYAIAGVAAAGFGLAGLTVSMPVANATCTGTADQQTACNWLGVFQPNTYTGNGQNNFLYSNAFTAAAQNGGPFKGLGTTNTPKGCTANCGVGNLISQYKPKH